MDENLLTTTNNPTSLSKVSLGDQPTFAEGVTADGINAQEQNLATTSTGVNDNFSFNVPQTLTSDNLAGETTLTDVFDQRAQAEAAQEETPDLGVPEDDFNTIFNDPTAEIQSILDGDGEQSDAEIEQARQLRGATRATERIGTQLSETRTRAEETTGFDTLSADLAQTSEDIARRQTRFRRQARAMEEDAQVRGFAREFVQGKQDKLKADATAELADLYIIQNAQSGNVANAERYITTAVNERYRIFETEIAQRQARLAELEPTLAGEAKKENLRLQLALTERQSQIDEQKAVETGKRQLLTTAAANGADANTRDRILNAQTLDEAYSIAGGYIGRLDRIKAEQSIANASLARRKSQVELAIAGDPAAIAALGDYGQLLSGAGDDSEEKMRESDYQEATAQIDIANALLANTDGLALATGTFRSPAAKAFGTAVPIGVAGGAAAGSVVPGLGTAIGSAIGLASGIGVGVKNYAEYNDAKDDFLSDVKALTGPLVLNELVTRKEQGATFGALSNQELGILASASSRLAGNIREDSSGQIVRLAGSEQNNKEDIALVINLWKKVADDSNRGELGDDDNASIDNLFNPKQ